MSSLSRHLKQLDEELLALGEETMLLEELDGFIAGLLVCPDLIKPGEWLQCSGIGIAPISSRPLDHANRVLGLVMEHYNSVARTLMERPDRYSPLFSVDTRNGDILGAVDRGLREAVELRPRAWQKLLNADADTATAMREMMSSLKLAATINTCHERRLMLNTTVPDNIALWVVTLNAYRLASYQPMPGIDTRMSSAPAKKVGRNDPCPCGSGKKYKKCCGLNQTPPPKVLTGWLRIVGWLRVNKSTPWDEPENCGRLGCGQFRRARRCRP